MPSAQAPPRLIEFVWSRRKGEKHLARHREAVCRLCRREGQKLFLKGLRCFTEKCAIEKRNFVPGQHGQARRAKIAGYGLQLREKQKVKRTYGLLERQFRTYVEKAGRAKGPTGENLIVMLERRLDNAVWRAGFASSRAQARQLVLHGHVRVSGKKVNIPSYLVSAGEEIALKDNMHQNAMVLEARNVAQSQNTVPWLEIDREHFKARVAALPKREDVTTPPITEQLIVELYSK
jgi:small subunit ribosomal protein S4